MKQVLIGARDCIRQVKRCPRTCQVFAGFDGFIDTIVRPVRQSNSEGEKEYFYDISEFTAFLNGKAGKSCSIELEKREQKAGGNTAIFARALSTLGIQTYCVGAFGYPERIDLFSPPNEKLFMTSVGNPGTCTALEFNDGKIMLAENEGIEELSFKCLMERAGQENLVQMVGASEMIAFMNWSEIPGSTEIWEGFLNDIFPSVSRRGKKKLFVDLSDCSKRRVEDIQYMLQLICRLSGFCDVILSVNQNEFERIITVSNLPGEWGFERMGKTLCKMYDLQNLIIHLRDGASAFSKSEYLWVKSRYIHRPVISTGGGDNFNAGFVFGILQGTDIATAVLLGNATSSFFVSHGYSPLIDQLEIYIQEWIINSERVSENCKQKII